MAQSKDKDPIAVDAPDAPADVAAKQDKESGWPEPGQEGFVHRDGTPQSYAQLEDNKRAAADRAKEGSVIHGAPLGTPGAEPGAETAKAYERAAKAGGLSTADETADAPASGVTLPPPDQRGGRKA